MTRNKTITEKDIYYFYPYKKNPPFNGKTIPQPYVKKKEVSDHKFALIYDVWLSVIEDYVKEVQDRLFQGRIVKFQNYLGEFQLKKYKIHRKIDWGETRKHGKKMYFKDRDLHTILIKWNRKRNICRFKNSDHWKIRMGSGFSNALHERCKDPDYVYSIIDI